TAGAGQSQPTEIHADQPQHQGHNGPGSRAAGAETTGGAAQMRHTEDHADQPQHQGHDGPGSPAAGADTTGGAGQSQPTDDQADQPHLLGRDFAAADEPGAPKVAIINETLARSFWGNDNPIGKRIGVGSANPDSETIGVIKDTKYRTLKEQIPRTVYLPFAKAEVSPTERTLHVRTAGEPKDLIAAIRHEAQTLDKDLPLYNIRAFTELTAEAMSQERIVATLSSFFGLLALLLASVGLYGVMAYAVARRTREIGVRLALGAQTGDVLRLIIRQGMALVVVGLVIGMAGALMLTRFIAGQLYGVGATDPATF